MQWRVYYTGEQTFSDKDGSPYDAPATSVLVICKADEQCGRVLVLAVDFYWWQNKTWFGGDTAGLYQHLMLDRGPKAVLFGRQVGNDEYDRAVNAALSDPDFPPKTARHRSEKRLVLP